MTFDLSGCAWGDPLPLLSAAIELQRFARAGGDVTIVLPDPDTSTPQVLQFLKFIASEGFLEQLGWSATILTDRGATLLKRADGEGDAARRAALQDAVRPLVSIRAELAYLNATCVRATVHRFDIDAHEDANRLIGRLMTDQVEATVHTYLPTWARDDILYRLELILKETVHNVIEHGRAGDGAWAGLYVRFRQGPRMQPAEQNLRWERALENEQKRCPLLREEYWLTRPGCIEIFVTDIGPGMAATLAPVRTRSVNYPFRRACVDAFMNGRSSKSNRRAPQGGLQLLSRLLGESNDFVRGLDGREWVGFSAPLQRGDATASAPWTGGNDDPPLTGLSWTFRLSWSAASDARAEGWHTWPDSIESHPVWSALRSKPTSAMLQAYKRAYLDDRRSRGVRDGGRSTARTHVLLPPPSLTKNDILAMIADIGEQRVGRPWMLIVADIPPREARTYLAALRGLTFGVGEAWAGLIERIILVTERWSVCVLARHDAAHYVRFDLDERASLDYLRGTYQGSLGYQSPARGVEWLAAYIRYQESLHLWRALQAQAEQQVFLPHDVAWGSSTSEIHGYLDFAQSQTSSEAMALYQVALRRVAGLVEGATDRPCRFKPFDRLTDVLADRVNGLGTRLPGALVHVGVGSILVTGQTSHVARIGAPTEFDVHFFAHPAYSGRPTPHLFLWPDSSWLRRRFEVARQPRAKLARVGRSSVVAPGGWKYFTLPRYDKEGRSIAERSPKATYADWQQARLPIVKTGHWAYGPHHDILGLNLVLASRISFRERGPLAAFVVREFRRQLQLSDEHFMPDAREWQRTSGGASEPSAQRGLIVYPAHTTTEHVVDSFMSLLEPEARKLVRRWFVPLRPIQRNVGGSAALISPLAIERVRDELNGSELSNKRVLLFDDAMVSGRTHRELEQVLLDAGADGVQVMVLVDRLRTPGSPRPADRREHFYRLDVPTAGGPRGCPLCRARGIAEDFASTVVTTDARRRIHAWIDEWAPASPITDWHRGLQSVPVDLAKPEKRFGLRWSEAAKDYVPVSPEKIRIDRSIGLAIYATELHAMTARDDVALALCKDAGVSAAASMEVIISQLALFGDEYDAQIRRDMLDLALRNAATREEPDPYTAGVALVALLERPELIGGILKALWRERAATLAGSEPGGTPRFNIDIELLTAYVIHRGVQLDMELRPSRRMLPSVRDAPAEVLDAFHWECCGDLGIVHSSPLWRLRRPSDWTPATVERAIDSLSKLEDLVTHLHGVWFYEEAWARGDVVAGARRPVPSALRGLTGRKARAWVLDQLCAHRERLEDVLRSARAPSAEDQASIEALFDLLGWLHALCFLRLRVSDVNQAKVEPPIETSLGKIIDEISEAQWRATIDEKVRAGAVDAQRWEGPSPRVRVTASGSKIPIDDRKDAWVLWSAPVRRRIRELLMNIVHGDGTLENPRRHTEKADGWVSVEYSSDAVIVQIRNSAAPSGPGVPSAHGPHAADQELREVGIEIDYIPPSDERRYYEIKVTLPYAGRQARLGRERLRSGS